jgi:hypothetical protein
MLSAGAVSGLGAGSPGGLNANAHEPGAGSKHLAWLSMWSAVRDTGCSGGAQMAAQPMCSSIAQSPGVFATALGASGAGG